MISGFHSFNTVIWAYGNESSGLDQDEAAVMDRRLFGVQLNSAAFLRAFGVQKKSAFFRRAKKIGGSFTVSTPAVTCPKNSRCLYLLCSDKSEHGNNKKRMHPLF